VLPFFFPPQHPALSGSYSAGFNNRIAVLSAGIACVLTFLWSYYFDSPREYSRAANQRPIPIPVVIACLIVCGLFTGGFGWLLTRSGTAYNDNLYFIEFMHSTFDFHLHIYRDFSFLYGPALLMWPVLIALLLHPFHVSMQASYFVALTMFQMAGVLLLWATLERVPLSRKSKISALCILSLSALGPLAGLNYGLVRALLPFSTLVFMSRIRRPLPMAVAFFFGEILQLLFSPELGVAFAAGACVYAWCQRAKIGRFWIVPAVSPFAGAVAFVGLMGKPYLDSIGAFSKGCLNLVVAPVPSILLFLVSAIWLTPVMVAGFLRQRRKDAALIAGLSVVSLGLLPVALGRCDLVHVFFNGVGLFLLASIALSGYSKRVRSYWWAVLLWFVLWIPFMGAVIFSPELKPVFPVAGTVNRQTIDIEKLGAIVGRDRIAVPFVIPYSVEQQLIDTQHYAPDRECFYIRIWDDEAETAKAQRMNQSHWALIPERNMRIHENSRASSFLVGMGFQYPDRRESWVYGNILYANLETHWREVTRFGGLILYEQKP
jgi:hypothetical protein